MKEESIVHQVRKIYDENLILSRKNSDFVLTINHIITLRNKLTKTMQVCKTERDVITAYKQFFVDEGAVLDKLKESDKARDEQSASQSQNQNSSPPPQT